MLKHSQRNCRRKRSAKRKSLKIERSSLANPGPAACVGLPPKAARPVRGIHPDGCSRIAVGASAVPPNTQGWVKAAAFRNWSTLCGPDVALFPGRSRALQPVPEVAFALQLTVIGCPPCTVALQIKLQLPTSPFVTRPELDRKRLVLPKGSS